MQVRVRGGQGAVGAAGRLLGQRHRALQERRRTGQPGAGLGALGGALELGGDGLVRPGGRGGQVPDPPVRVGLRVDRLGQGAVRGPALLRRARGVGGRPHERVPEPHPGADLEQLLGPSRLGRVVAEAERAAPPATAAWGRRSGRRPRSAAQPLGGLGQRPHPPQVVVLEQPGGERRGPEGEAAGQLGVGHPADQLEQRQRVAAGLRDEPVADPLVEVARRGGGQQRPGVVVGRAPRG